MPLLIQKFKFSEEFKALPAGSTGVFDMYQDVANATGEGASASANLSVDGAKGSGFGFN